MSKINTPRLPQTKASLSKKQNKHHTTHAMSQVQGQDDLINETVNHLTLQDVNWLYQFFTTADTDGDFEVSQEDLVQNIQAGPQQKDKLFYFFSGIDTDHSGSIDFSEWLNWGARDGDQLLHELAEEKGLTEASLRDPNAKMPCGEERLRIIEQKMRESGEIGCSGPNERAEEEGFGEGGCPAQRGNNFGGRGNGFGGPQSFGGGNPGP